MMNIPIIKLEVESMRHSIVNALTEYEANLSQEIKSAVDRFCTPETIARVVSKEVERVLEAVIKEEIYNFYSKGEGRKTVKDAVIKRLEENKTSLDW